MYWRSKYINVLLYLKTSGSHVLWQSYRLVNCIFVFCFNMIEISISLLFNHDLGNILKKKYKIDIQNGPNIWLKSILCANCSKTLLIYCELWLVSTSGGAYTGEFNKVWYYKLRIEKREGNIERWYHYIRIGGA